MIEILDHMGQDAEQRYASPERLETALDGLRIDPELRTAIVARDHRQLEGLLGYVPFCCLISPAKEGDSDEE